MYFLQNCLTRRECKRIQKQITKALQVNDYSKSDRSFFNYSDLFINQFSYHFQPNVGNPNMFGLLVVVGLLLDGETTCSCESGLLPPSFIVLRIQSRLRDTLVKVDTSPAEFSQSAGASDAIPI